MDWKPNRIIKYTPQNGSPLFYVLMLDEDGAAYSYHEWEATEAPSWCIDEGCWYCEGKATPGGVNGEVQIFEFEWSENDSDHRNLRDLWNTLVKLGADRLSVLTEDGENPENGQVILAYTDALYVDDSDGFSMMSASDAETFNLAPVE